ncbi:MAG: hypothetical protein ACOYNB_03595 [Aquabacterium sp.]|uniref:hypothetical protein n=1 Tax=Aquabacterium sp. TaxID=1872578 RepID=UPI003BC6B502
MDKEHIQRIQEWNQFKVYFYDRCKNFEPIKKLLESNIVHHSLDYDNPKKSQLVIAFTENPINFYRGERGQLNVEHQWGCRLIYELEYNGEISCRALGYEGEDLKIRKYRSANKISAAKLIKDLRTFLLIEENINKTKQPKFTQRLKYKIHTKLSAGGIPQLLLSIAKQIPWLGKIITSLAEHNKP